MITLPNGAPVAVGPARKERTMNPLGVGIGTIGLAIAVSAACSSASQAVVGQEPIATAPKPNIVFIMADDVGWFNIGAYHQGMMASRTPHLDSLAAEGTRFTDYYDATDEPRWGKVGKQRIEDDGPLAPERMKTVDNEFVESAVAFMKKAKDEGKPFFVYLNPTRMHVFTHLSDEYASKQTGKNSWYTYEAGMAQLDDIVGSVLGELKSLGVADDTIVAFTTDNGAEVMTWPDGGITPFAGEKGMVLEGGMRVPMIVRWPGKIPANRVENAVMSGLDWFPTLVSAAGNPKIVEELVRGTTIGDTEYNVHLDGYDQLDLLTGKGPTKRDKVWYFAEGKLGAARIGDWKYRFIDQPGGWFGGTTTTTWPVISNLRLDPFERTDPTKAPPALSDFYGREMWRFVFIQDEVEKLAKTFVEFPPMQKHASLNLDSVKEQVAAAIAKQQSQ
jgi:arylsulfatase A-like enzyme